jgi:CRP-like cAMP-binding protein
MRNPSKPRRTEKKEREAIQLEALKRLSNPQAPSQAPNSSQSIQSRVSKQLTIDDVTLDRRIRQMRKFRLKSPRCDPEEAASAEECPSTLVNECDVCTHQEDNALEENDTDLPVRNTNEDVFKKKDRAATIIIRALVSKLQFRKPLVKRDEWTEKITNENLRASLPVDEMVVRDGLAKNSGCRDSFYRKAIEDLLEASEFSRYSKMCSPEDISAIEHSSGLSNTSQLDFLFRKDIPIDDCYIILSGHLEVEESNESIIHLGPGQAVGFKEMIENVNAVWPSSGKALTSITACRIPSAVLRMRLGYRSNMEQEWIRMFLKYHGAHQLPKCMFAVFLFLCVLLCVFIPRVLPHLFS